MKLQTSTGVDDPRLGRIHRIAKLLGPGDPLQLVVQVLLRLPSLRNGTLDGLGCLRLRREALFLILILSMILVLHVVGGLGSKLRVGL